MKGKREKKTIEDCIYKTWIMVDKIQTSEYEKSGTIPVVDQSKSLIAGFYNGTARHYNWSLPVIIYWDHTNVIKYIDFPFICGADWVKVFSFKEGCDPKYFYYALSFLKPKTQGYRRHYSLLKEIQIPLPPLEEQKKIVAYLDELNATISKLKSEYQSQLAMLDEMQNSSLDLAFWGSREREYNLNNWKWVKLGGIAQTQSGGTPSRSNPLYRWEGIVRLKSWELEDNDCITKYTETITVLGLENSSAKKFTKGTLLLAMYGATAWKLWILWIDAATNQVVCAIQNTQNKFVEKYIYYFLLKERDKIIRDSFWWAQPNISKTYIDNIELPLPDLETQSQIVSHLDQVHQQITMLKTQVNSQIEHCDELWQSCLEKVLTQGME